MPLVLDGSGGISGVDGTASNPAIEGTDSNTGIFYPAADTVAIGTGGTEALRVNSSQNVGIGTSSPIEKLTVAGGIAMTAAYSLPSGTSALTLGYDSGSNVANITSLTSGTAWRDLRLLANNTLFLQGGTERMRLDSSGNLGLGQTASTRKFEINAIPAAANQLNGLRLQMNGVSTSLVDLLLGTDGGGIPFTSLRTGNDSNSFMTFFTGSGPTERARITSGGDLLVGTTSAGDARLGVEKSINDHIARFNNTATSGSVYGPLIRYTGQAPNNTSSIFFVCSDTSVTRAEIRSNGGLANYSANNVNLSDRREKTNFAPAKNYLDVICAIPVQTFNYIDQNMEEDPGETLGVVAQDVQEVAPELVMESNWGTAEEPKMRLSIYQTDLQYALMKSIQELKAIVDAQAAEIAALKAQP